MAWDTCDVTCRHVGHQVGWEQVGAQVGLSTVSCCDPLDMSLMPFSAKVPLVRVCDFSLWCRAIVVALSPHWVAPRETPRRVAWELCQHVAGDS